jgi:hypothetical protein
MWLIDHQMNMQISNEFGQYFVRLPLKKAAKIVNGDALKTDWQSLLNPENTINVSAKHANIFIVKEPIIEYKTVNVQTETFAIHKGKQPSGFVEKKFDYILGNPPFIGSKMMTQPQRDSVVKEFHNTQGAGVLDYVTAWYVKAAKYIQGTKTKVAFVSTNSIVQGEQTSILWGQMLNKYNIKIHFAHRTFKWSNEAKGNAAVYCVIIGFANFETNDKSIFEYEDIRGEAHEIKAKNINPYLVDAKDILINKRTNPICNVPKIKFGNQPIDGGFLLFAEDDKVKAIEKEPFISKYIRKYVGSVEFINNIPRYCLWLKNAEPADLRRSIFLSERLKHVKIYRENSPRKDTRVLANIPSQFAFVSHNESEYIIIPSVSSERRRYIPIGFMPSNVIASNLCLIIPDAKMFHFGILTSEMHMSWVRNICGRLKSDYRYSNSVVYNNFPWPENPSQKQIKAIEKAAQKVLGVRLQFPNNTLADLYDPLTMPPALIKAHNDLDKAVDLAYRPQAFANEANRMVFLFELYEKYTAGIFTTSKKKVFKITKHDDRK